MHVLTDADKLRAALCSVGDALNLHVNASVCERERERVPLLIFFPIPNNYVGRKVVNSIFNLLLDQFRYSTPVYIIPIDTNRSAIEKLIQQKVKNGINANV